MSCFQNNLLFFFRDYLFQKVGDVVFVVGRLGEGIGICSNMSCYKFCCFMIFRFIRIFNFIMVYIKIVLMRKKEKRYKRKKQEK